MKTISTKIIAASLASISLFACNAEEEQELVEPMKASQEADLVGYDPTTCNLVQNFGSGELPRAVDIIEEDGAVMIVKAQRRGHNGKYLEETEGLLLDPSTPSTNLINPFDAQMLGVYGLLTVGDASGEAVNEQGGRLILDFSPVGSVTMKTMVLTDIDEDEAGSKVELFSKTGQRLDEQLIPAKGDKAAVILSFDNVPGVAKAVVTFGADRRRAGSGAVARLQLCVEGVGRRDEARFNNVQSLWLEYTGDKPANVAVRAKEGESSNAIFTAKGMKPGTMFKLSASANGSLGEALEISTNHKEQDIIPTNANPNASLKAQYGSFRVVEARCSDYPLQLEE
ncbi:hypothetical protein [Pontibacter mangrovi]|uniref:Uncharacterized protein n=1 Tax=Pontibacter mangrovi TaxID=2589816 RepID=A0A501WAL7_9BACT|nr:hypothetical protein [Pontibacter mangrovi]TPE45535.1 hypothetical protein FJM65_05785 [Pontibacter mangrovi]